MESVDEALAETGLVSSLAPPLALSAKKALAGKLGDAQALERVGMGARCRRCSTSGSSRAATS